MDVFEALGLDLPDTTRSMSVTDAADADAELLQFLAPVFGWTDKEASANSLILFPGESQQDVVDGGLVEVPSVNGKQGEQAEATTSGKVQPAPTAAKPSPFSGVTQFDIFLGDMSTTADASGTFNVPAGADPADPFSGGAALASPFAQPGDIAMGESHMQAQFSEGLIRLLEEPGESTQQQQLPQPPSGAQQQQQQQETAAVPQPPSLPQQTMVHPLAALPQQQQQQQQQPAVVVDLGLPNVSAAPLGMAAPQLVPPPLPQLPLQQPQHPVVLPQQQMGLLPGLQPQPVFQPLASPLLTQAQQQQQLQLGQAPVPLRLPQLGQPLPLPVLQLSQQLLQQRQAAQQQQQAAQQQVSNQALRDADGASDADNRHYSSQPKRRGRPPKVPGQYSKGYEAIKRYREKKKGMVEHMEAEIAEKREELHKLQAEQEALRSRQLALESTMSNQDKLLAQLLQLKMSLAGRAESGDVHDLEATTAAAMAGVRQALAMQNGGDTGEAEALAAAAAAEQHQRLLLKKQQAQQKVLLEGPVFLRRYQGYVQAVADRLSHAAAAAAGGSTNNVVEQHPALGSFPTFPFTLIETLSLWQLSRLAILTRTDMKGQSSTEPWDDFTLNLSSGQHDLVPQDFWKAVAQQIGLHSEQPQQLLAAWRLYVSAMNRLNEERQGLLMKLQEAAAAEDAVLADAQQQPAGVGSRQDSPAHTHSSGPAAAAAALGSGHSSPASFPQGAAAVVGGSSAAPINRRTGTAALDVAFVYMDLLDAVERNLLRGRAIIMMFGWSMLCMLSAEQIGRVCVASWPYFPLMRAIVGYMLGKEDLVP